MYYPTIVDRDIIPLGYSIQLSELPTLQVTKSKPIDFCDLPTFDFNNVDVDMIDENKQLISYRAI